jgi:heme exporter protein A
MQVMFDVAQLACLRGERLLFKKLGFKLKSGQVLRVTGANGCGKTSLLRLLAGLAQTASGSICWQGTPIQRQRDVFHARLLYLGHAPALNDLLTPLENLRFACAAAGIAADQTACLKALTDTGLNAQLDLPCKALSQGQRRRVALARLTLARAQPLWILDEPFTALDQAATGRLAAQFDTHADTGGLIIYTSHQEVEFSTRPALLNVEDFAP